MYAIMTASCGNLSGYHNIPAKSEEFEEKITPKTSAVIVNTPHNPTGVVYSEETIKETCCNSGSKTEGVWNCDLSDLRMNHIENWLMMA